jgi:hypothetical protein
MKRLITAVGLALAAASTAACGGTHTTSSPTTVTVTTTATMSVAPVTPVTPVAPVMPPTGVRQWVNAGQLDFYVEWAFDVTDEVDIQMYVKNTSGVPQTYSAGAQMLMDHQGRLFAPTLVGADGINSSDPPSGAIDQFDLNPGMASGKVYLYFKVSPGTTLDQFSLVVHGSHTSVGSSIHLHGTHSDPP